MESSADPPVDPSYGPPIIKEKLPFPEMIVLYFNHHELPPGAIKKLVANKFPGSIEYGVKEQESIVGKTKFLFPLIINIGLKIFHGWVWNTENLGKFIAQGQTSFYELRLAIDLTDSDLKEIEDIVKLPAEHPTRQSTDPLRMAAKARVMDNRIAQGLAQAPQQAQQSI